jgi:hypothetical protein
MFYPSGDFRTEKDDAMLALRPEGATLLEKENDVFGLQVVKGVVQKRTFTGQTYRVTVEESRGSVLIFDLPNRKPPPGIGEGIVLKIDSSCMVLVEKSEEEGK